MPTDLALHIENSPLADTHEHLNREQGWVEEGPDILQDLFGNYVPADLIAAEIAACCGFVVEAVVEARRLRRSGRRLGGLDDVAPRESVVKLRHPA